MKTIEHLPADEQKHFILCDCGDYVDMRNLADVFSHLHLTNIEEPDWTYSVKIGEPKAYSKTHLKTYLN
jgi:hypothetical protein